MTATDYSTQGTMTLYQLNALVSEAIADSLDTNYWVQAEISEAREVRGHFYMELIQKDPFSATPVARASAKCWNNKWQQIRSNFVKATGQLPHQGMKVMLRVSPDFHPAYGFAWIVTDIDPTYTLGDMAAKRMAIIRQLKEEGVFDLQKSLTIPMFAMRIAVISSASAAGYGDFCNHLADNSEGFPFTTRLFPAIMQGEQVQDSVIAALNSIYDNIADFDVVVIIRGGGATADLSGFDTLALAENVANFPLPIITGIGHERDESVIDMVANTKVKTPTAAAALLIDNLMQVATTIDNCSARLVAIIAQRLQAEELRLRRLAERIPTLFATMKANSTARLDTMMMRITNSAAARMTAEHHRIQMLQQRAEALDPKLLLKRGYTMTIHNGHILKDVTKLTEGDTIETITATGRVTSEVKFLADFVACDDNN
ncbi:MAG: exodeoxyribonuclease VII large subunit [Prevotella sp.]